MHQDHSLQWHTVAKNLTLKVNKDHQTGYLLPKHLPSQHQSLQHFARVFDSTIQEFSRAERAKYPPRIETLCDHPVTGKLFSDELLFDVEKGDEEDKFARPAFDFAAKNKNGVYSYSENLKYLNRSTQQLSYWIKPIESIGLMEELADTANALLYANEMEGLISLAQRPDVPLIKLRKTGYQAMLGFDHLADCALRAYLFLNIAEAALGDKFVKQLNDLQEYKRLFDFYSMNLLHAAPHVEFFDQEYLSIRGTTAGHDPAKVFGEDFGRLKGYLKMCFALLVRYDMLMRELGVDPKWETRAVDLIAQLFSVPATGRECERDWMYTKFADVRPTLAAIQKKKYKRGARMRAEKKALKMAIERKEEAKRTEEEKMRERHPA